MTDSPDFSDLSAVFINTTLKKSPEKSHTDGLVTMSADIMREHGVAVTEIRAIDHPIATGVYPDMTEHGWDVDAWPGISETDHGRRDPRPGRSHLAG